MYTITSLAAVKKDIKGLDRKLIEKIKTEEFPKIEKEPYGGEPLSYEFKGLWSYHFSCQGTEYRIVYEIYPEKKIVLVIMIGKRERFYEALKRRVG
ncbi:type II toxin-antitoxin system RelE/ParE family toxin [bacterium]|nr:type II toxin-antitoxin system RelE/ParE family toxin [bacterium]MBU1752315.1 type II toxin-antitoxin system RelE/ParE family toxin [bacterium]